MKQIILEETFLTTHAFSLTILWGVGTYNDPSSVPSMVTLRLSVYSSLDTGLSWLDVHVYTVYMYVLISEYRHDVTYMYMYMYNNYAAW